MEIVALAVALFALLLSFYAAHHSRRSAEASLRAAGAAELSARSGESTARVSTEQWTAELERRRAALLDIKVAPGAQVLKITNHGGCVAHYVSIEFVDQGGRSGSLPEPYADLRQPRDIHPGDTFSTPYTAATGSADVWTARVAWTDDKGAHCEERLIPTT